MMIATCGIFVLTAEPSRTRSRLIRMIAIVAVMAILAATFVWYLFNGEMQVKVVNRARGTMTNVRLVMGNGKRFDLPSIAPDVSSEVRIRRAEAPDIRLVYDQPDGVVNDLILTAFRRWPDLSGEDKIVITVMAHMTNGQPTTIRYSIQQRKRYDPAIYLPFAPGAED